MRSPSLAALLALALLALARPASAADAAVDDELAPGLVVPRAAPTEPPSPAAPLAADGTPVAPAPVPTATDEGSRGPWALTFALTAGLVIAVLLALRRREPPPAR